ncbi:long-chain fatty acid--CoA ligase [Actinokineospora auranticolor]|uniref:Acyl-CoA synthetase (AMP-forming)/AMP-acid ligase II n=1 Tax=Actinokineospora auranticolor TaxID=155976 RepID=A0A2S6GT58_9PSEU|nr:fatty acid--CoA ligase family protein [Actinokineospora auranticolor]PPK68357.1 acyl-CoA synthetase (AMP-forming)/AMP-acid ligase II [Actinokineospora auranticolor]
MTGVDLSWATPGISREWVDDLLLAGSSDTVCLRFDEPVDRAALRAVVAVREAELRAAGLVAGGTVALRLPPSLAYVGYLLAAWRIGAQVSLLDHRLTRHEVDGALDRVAAQFVVEATETRGHRLRGYAEVVAAVSAREGGRPAATPHALVQFSSGSTGASKVIARTAADLAAELDRYDRLPEFPRAGERVVLLASIVHVLGLVGGLLNALHANAELVFPQRLTAEGILAAVAAADTPATVLGVPFHAELLTSSTERTPLPSLRRMVVAGELVRPTVPARFRERFGVPLGTMYGMTEIGVIATDLDGSRWPAVEPTHGMRLQVRDGELWIAMAASPYLGLQDPSRFVDGWLRTRDAAGIDGGTGLVTVLGRLDSQVSIGGLKVDLTEVEQTIAGMAAVREAVVLHDGGVRAYLSLADGASVAEVELEIGRTLAPFKRPRELVVLPVLPRTATGKVVRAAAVLAAAGENSGKG